MRGSRGQLTPEVFAEAVKQAMAANDQPLKIGEVIKITRSGGSGINTADIGTLVAEHFRAYPEHMARFPFAQQGLRRHERNQELKKRNGERGWNPETTKVLSVRAEIFEGRHRPILVCRCDRCGTTAEITHKPGYPPEPLIGAFRNKNWEVDGDGDSATCPDCITNRRYLAARHHKVEEATDLPGAPIDEIPEAAPPPPPAEEATMPNPTVSLSVVPPVAQPSLTAAKKNRRLYGLLDDHYDETRKRYREGWTDAKIARECELSVEHVANTRESAYGPAGPSPEVEAFQEAVRELRAKNDSETTALEEMIRAHKAQIAEGLRHLEARLHTLQQRGAA